MNKAQSSSQKEEPLLEAATSSNLNSKLETIRTISNFDDLTTNSENQKERIAALCYLMEDRDQTIRENLYNSIGQICGKNACLRKVSVKRLERNIWVLLLSPDLAKSVLANLIRTFKECSDAFLKAMDDQCIVSTRFQMIHFLKEFDIYSERFHDFHKKALLEIWTIDNNLRTMEQVDESFNYYGFLEHLLNVYMNQEKPKVKESDIIKCLEYKKLEKEDVKNISKTLAKFFEVVPIQNFSSTLEQVQKTFSEEILKQCSGQFTEDVRKGTSRCDEKRFMCKIEVVALTYSNVVLAGCLLKRIGLLNSECEETRTMFAMTLIRVSLEQTNLRSQNDPVIGYISKYISFILPTSSDTCVVSLKHAKLAINLIYYLFDRRNNPSFKNQLSLFLSILRDFVGTTRKRMAKQMAEEVMSDIRIALKTTTRGQKMKPCVPLHRTVFNTGHAKSYLNEDYYIARINGEFVGKLIGDE